MQPLATFIFTVAAGISSLILASKLRIPSILFFLLFGIFLGPEYANLVQPQVFRSNFPQYIALMVALILFEGGSSLKFSQFREISKSLRKLLTVGMLFTLVGVTVGAHYIAHLSWTKSMLFGAIMVVTGPTVVIPILRRLRLQEKVHNVLKWEAILIDPLGVIVAVVLFEFFVLQHGTIWHSLAALGGRLTLGVVLGWITGLVMVNTLTNRWLLRAEGEELGGLFVLSLVLLSYGFSEFILSESGLVTVTVAGIYFGQAKVPLKDQIDHFKDQVVLFALSILFVLLASNVPVREATQIFREGLLLICFIILLVRPISVLLSTFDDKSLNWKEKLFVAFMAPRGIVSASLASLFAIEFEHRDLSGEGHFLPLAFVVISGTIVFYAVISAFIAHILGVKEGKRNGIVIVGATAAGLLLAREIKNRKVNVKMIDVSFINCERARSEGLEIYQGSGFDVDFLESLDLKGIGKMIAVTTNHEVNVLCCQTFTKYLDRNSVFRLWDKTDSWQAVTSENYDSSWGKPFLVGAPAQFSLDRLLQTGEYELYAKKVESSQKITQDLMTKLNPDCPVFAWSTDGLHLLIPQDNLPGGSELICLRPKSAQA